MNPTSHPVSAIRRYFAPALLGLASLCSVSAARAGLIAYESFGSYATNASLHQKTGGYGWANEWNVNTAVAATVNGTALTYTFPGSTTTVGGGKSLKISGNSSSALRRNIAPKVAGETLYLSFLVQLRGVNYGQAIGSGVNILSGWMAHDKDANPGADTSGVVGHEGKAGARIASATTPFNTQLVDGTTYFVVVKYDGWSANDRYKRSTVWLNPALGSETSTYNNGRRAIQTSVATNSNGSFGFLGLQVFTDFANSGYFQLVDDIRIGTTWNDVVSGTPATIEDGDHPDLVVFGDSLSNGGNNGVISTGPTPAPDVGAYPKQTWIQQLAPAAGYGVLHKSDIPGGTNYAVGGHTTTQMAGQVTQYLNSRGGIADPNAVYVLWCGPNDIRVAAQNTPSKFLNPSGFATEIRLRMKTQIENLIKAGRSANPNNGAKKLVWVQMPDVTKTPALNGYPSALHVPIRSVVTAFNDGMSASISSLETAYPDVDIHLMPANEWLTGFINDPGDYDFTNVDDASLTSNDHLFYDEMHPTAHGHYEFAIKALEFFGDNGLIFED